MLQNLIESSHIGEQEKQDASIEQEEKKAELERIIEYETKGTILRVACVASVSVTCDQASLIFFVAVERYA